MLFLACSLHMGFSAPAGSSDSITRYWIFFSWTKKEQINITKKKKKLTRCPWKKIKDFFKSIFYLIPKAMLFGKHHYFPNSSSRFSVHDYIRLCPFPQGTHGLLFLRKPHRICLGPGTKHHSHLKQHEISQIKYFALYFVKNHSLS